LPRPLELKPTRRREQEIDVPVHGLVGPQVPGDACFEVTPCRARVRVAARRNVEIPAMVDRGG